MSTSAYQWAKPHALFGLKVIAAQPVQPIARPILQPGIGGSFNPTSLFSPASLFAAGEQGVWYDPSDMSTMFQDATGTTPVTAVEQPVGRILDKSGRGHHATLVTATSRPVLSARVNLLTATETLATQTVATRATTQTLRFEGAGTVTLSGTATGTYSAGSHSVTTTAGNLTLTVSGTVTKADLRAANMGVGLPAYQRVNTATDYDTAGFPMYLRFDGVDDCLVTPSINFTGTDKMTVFAGVHKLSDSATAGILVELSTNTNATNGSFAMTANDAGSFAYVAYSKGTEPWRFAASPLSYYAPDSRVLRLTSDIAGSLVALGVNGVQVKQDTSSQGTGNYGNYPIYIGRRAGTSFPFNGHIYSLIVRGAQSTAQQIASAETWVNQRTGAY